MSKTSHRGNSGTPGGDEIDRANAAFVMAAINYVRAMISASLNQPGDGE
jgi:hypothetical protein